MTELTRLFHQLADEAEGKHPTTLSYFTNQTPPEPKTEMEIISAKLKAMTAKIEASKEYREAYANERDELIRLIADMYGIDKNLYPSFFK